MSNMSYCRFENTAADLRECLEAIEGFDVEGAGDEETGITAFVRQLSEDEQQGFRALLARAKTLIEVAEGLEDPLDWSERRIYQAQGLEDARADREHREPLCVTTMEQENSRK